MTVQGSELIAHVKLELFLDKDGDDEQKEDGRRGVRGCWSYGRYLEGRGKGGIWDSSAGEKESSIPEATANRGSSPASTCWRQRDSYREEGDGGIITAHCSLLR